MRKLICLCIAIILSLSFCLSTSADATNENVIEVNGYTIIFDETSTLTQEEKLHIAQIRVNHLETTEEATPYGVMCDLFGHKTTTETISVIEHCVRDTPPRCLQTYEDLTVCSRCDYVNIEVVGSIHIYCCD